MDDIKANLGRYQTKPRNTHLHSELHLLVDEVRTLFGETAKKGPGSFSFYLGFFKRLGVKEVRQLLAEVKENKVDNPGRKFKKQKTLMPIFSHPEHGRRIWS
jgi:hypothetical protein